MTIDLDKYRDANYNLVIEYIGNYKHLTLSELANNITCICHDLPIIVSYYFIGEITGFTPEINRKIEMLKKFYNYDDIIGTKESEDVQEKEEGS